MPHVYHIKLLVIFSNNLTGDSEEDGIWLAQEKQEIVIKVDATVASYFKRRRLIANQVIEKKLADGGLIISTKVGHPNQVLPIVRYWIPNLRIISPEGLQAELEKGLANYIGLIN